MSDALTISEQQFERVTQPRPAADYLLTERRVPPRDAGVSLWLVDVQRQLDAIKRLPPGWNSHGAPAPNRQVVDSAEQLLKCLCAAGALPRPHVNPTPAGGVQFEWQSASRYFEIEVVAERAAQYLYCDDAAGVEKVGEVFEDEPLEEVLACIRLVAAGQ
ncbi:MAG: hypothetical protein NUV77_12520 [Thermoguttaceae bacterium]|jgi:hypothetical protein|nr:hypothetical protein [Thermoguttaceae bacterium]